MVKINFDKYDTSCKDNVWSWNIPNRNNTKNIKVVVKFEPGISFPTSTVEDMYFEEEDTDRHAVLKNKEEKLEKIKNICNINKGIDWICSTPDLSAEEEFQAIIDIIDEKEEK